MKKIILGIFITITTLLSVSCAKEMDAPCSTPISGKWANDVWADRYIMFEAGYIYEYVSDEAYYVCDKIVWNCMDSDFDQFAANRYSIVDGKLVTKTLNEKITVQDSVMMIGYQKYVLIEEFNEEQYSKILPSSENLVKYTYAAQSVEWNYSIENPVDGQKLEVVAPDWVTDVLVTDGKITFNVPESKEDKQGKFILHYDTADDVEISVTQTAARSINVNKTSTWGYAASDCSISYTIENPEESFVLEAEVDKDWISDVKVNEGNISFKVSENNTGSSRTATLKLSYPEAKDVEIVITQYRLPLDLSSLGTANCYIVSETGEYKFKTVKGNSDESVGDVASVDVLWESFGTDTAPSIGDLVKNVTYEDGYIAFEATDKKGNAVIAAKDADGKILWSWHIWLTDQPQAQVYKNNAGTMMDRNLGATSATPGDVGALGLLYQWGRKDPFLGSSSISSNTLATSTLTWPEAVRSTSETGTIDYVISNPTTFVTSSYSNDYDWHYGSRNNTLWQSSKTIYDPCPAGWRVPDGGDDGVWSKALGSSAYFDYTYDSTNEGISFSISSPSTTWYPASGYRGYSDGGLGSVGYDGNYWSVTPYSNDACYLYFDRNGYVDPSSGDTRARGYAVRCLQVIDEVAEP